MNQGWIKLHRSLLNNALWKDCNSNQKVVMITLLLMADHKENTWIYKDEKYTTKPGEFITSLPSIAEASGCSVQVVRTCLLKFEKHGFLTCKSTNKNRLINIENWGKYQLEDDEVNRQPNRQLTGTEQAINRQLTSNKNVRMKECKNDLNIVEQDSTKYPYQEVIDYLNKKTNKSYKKTSRKTQSLIKARINEGYSLIDFKKVIDNKTSEWIDDNKMQKFLRPETLFGTKFEGYLNQQSQQKKTDSQFSEENLPQWMRIPKETR